ncbi:uncharacterized protein DS421_14g471420 [Arachis hypogaea]|nr:uncharacterized protein DS421_14g471420 [Arachis hypogaea]
MSVNHHHLSAPSSAPPRRGRTPDGSSSLACRLALSLISHPMQSRRARAHQPPPRSEGSSLPRRHQPTTTQRPRRVAEPTTTQ